MPGFDNNVVYADNVDFSGGSPVEGKVTTNGQLLIGSTASPNIRVATLTEGTGISITNGPGTITIGLSGSGQAIDSITPNSGVTPIVPDSNGNITLVGSGSITNVGSSNTGTIQLTGLTQYNVLVGAGTDTITKVAPSATSGVPLISQGASANPAFGTAVVAGGGTGLTTATAYAVLCGGTTATGAFQSIASVGSANQVLTSNGAGALPTFQSVSATGAFNQVVIQEFTANGTYTPTSGMKYCIVEVVGGGGGGGGAIASSGSKLNTGGGGGSGGYARSVFSAATIGASQTVTIGAAGTAGANTGGTGGTGGTTSLGALISATGGTGGTGSTADAAFSYQAGGTGGAGTGTVTATGNNGGRSSSYIIPTVVGQSTSGWGANSPFGPGGQEIFITAAQSAGNAGSKGGGGSGGASISTGTAVTGGAGGAGYMVITEFVSA